MRFVHVLAMALLAGMIVGLAAMGKGEKDAKLYLALGVFLAVLASIGLLAFVAKSADSDAQKLYLGVIGSLVGLVGGLAGGFAGGQVASNQTTEQTQQVEKKTDQVQQTANQVQGQVQQLKKAVEDTPNQK